MVGIRHEILSAEQRRYVCNPIGSLGPMRGVILCHWVQGAVIVLRGVRIMLVILTDSRVVGVLNNALGYEPSDFGCRECNAERWVPVVGK
jgi:hypothetical protein